MARKEMSIEDFRDLCRYVDACHSFRDLKGKKVKYISPTMDMRTGMIFHVNMRLVGKGMDFALTNENKDKDLKEWIFNWLDNGKWSWD